MQKPPDYSAVKVKGVPSYKLARQGKQVPLASRAVKIHGIDLTDYHDPYISVTVRCSKGVYIRSLCSEIGQVLGMGAHLASLVRTSSGRYRIDDAISLDELSRLSGAGLAESVFMPIDRALDEMPSVTVEGTDARRISHGNRIAGPEKGMPANSLLRIHDETGCLLAIARAGAGGLEPEMVFAESP
jgi:tRNA pseudouridine55 synthase